MIDPSGTFGIAIVQSSDEAEVRAFGEADPAITSGIGMSFDVFPMPGAVVRPHAGG